MACSVSTGSILQNFINILKQKPIQDLLIAVKRYKLNWTLTQNEVCLSSLYPIGERDNTEIIGAFNSLKTLWNKLFETRIKAA